MNLLLSRNHKTNRQERPNRPVLHLKCGRLEPRLDDLMHCEVLVAVMKRDSISRHDLNEVIRQAQTALAKRKAA